MGEHVRSGSSTMDDPIVDGARPYGILLVLVLSSIVAPLALPTGAVGLAAGVGLQSVTVVAALGVVQVPRRPRRMVAFAFAMAAVVIAAALGVDAVSTDDLLGLGRGVALVLAVVVPTLIVWDVARHPRITIQAVLAALCVFLLLGLAFALGHGLVDTVAPGSYSEALDETTALYLSYVTLTTVGFGDITPVGGAARALTLTEAVLGQLYLVSVVALLVGNVGRTRDRGR